MPDIFDRADEKLREHGHASGSDKQNDNGLTGRPLRAAFHDILVTALEKVFMSPESETEDAEVGKKQDDGDS